MCKWQKMKRMTVMHSAWQVAAAQQARQAADKQTSTASWQGEKTGNFSFSHCCG
jgi:hypothetical protein